MPLLNAHGPWASELAYAAQDDWLPTSELLHNIQSRAFCPTSPGMTNQSCYVECLMLLAD
jgi:hypothetical protein